MTTLQDHRQRLSNAWRGDQEDARNGTVPNANVARDGEVVRRPLTLMDHRTVLMDGAGRSIPLATDAERQASTDLVLKDRQRVSNAWKNPGGHSDTDDAEEAALASVAAVQGTSAPVKPAPTKTGDAVADARAAMHHRLENQWRNQ